MELRISITHRFLSSRNFFLILIVVMSVLEHVPSATHFGNKTDLLALLKFKNYISDDPNGGLNSWNNSLHHCQWQGVTCSAKHRRVIAIALRGMMLYGSLSPHMGNLSFLKSIELEENRISGEIPQEVGRLFRLRILNLTGNTLTGNIPVNLSRCLDLRAIDLNGNALKGQIPYELISLKKLSVLRLSVNNLTGEFPSFLGNLTLIKKLSLANNNLVGSLPQEIGLLKSLSFLAVGANKLTEYGIGGEASTEGDVYSFGILLLEMFSGRKPTDDIFVDDLNLHIYVEMNLQDNVEKITDPLLLLSEGIEDEETYIASLFKIGLRCSASSPNDRMDMHGVLRELQSIKEAILGA